MIELPPINLGEIDGSTARLMRSYGLSCARAAMERAAQICETLSVPWDIDDWMQMTKRDVSARTGRDCAAAIRKETLCQE